MIPFRGNRDYNWGPDIGKIILDYQKKILINQLSDVFFKINRFSNRDIIIKCERKLYTQKDEELLVGTLQFKNDNKVTILYLYEEESKSYSEKINFEESNYLSQEIEYKSNDEILVKSTDHPLAIIVCANKYLLSNKYTNRKWTFASLKIKQYPIPRKSFLLKYKYSISEKVFLTDIFQNKAKIGQIVFGVKN